MNDSSEMNVLFILSISGHTLARTRETRPIVNHVAQAVPYPDSKATTPTTNP